MVGGESFRILSNEEKSRYEFEFCQGCVLYDECELAEDYRCFRLNHPQIHKSQTPQATGALKVKAAVTRIGDREVTPLPSCVRPADDSSKLSYAQENSNHVCIIKSIHTIACGMQRVTEGIGKHYQIEIRKDHTLQIVAGTTDRWEPLQPVFISAPTGRGKNYFVENELIPYVEDLNYKNNTSQRILIFSNRLALQQQIQDRLNGSDDADDGEGKIYHYRDCADVMTYQSLLQRKRYLMERQSKAHSRYIYVICDEAHFFSSDAMFNPHTAKILEAIAEVFQDAIRVYMSATPYECLKPIIDYELERRWKEAEGSQLRTKSIPMAFYHFKRDYSYLDVKAYSEISELYEQIVDSVNKRKEKWLIFIDDRQRGAAVKRKLLECEEEYAEMRGWSLFLNGGAEESAEEKKTLSKEEIAAKAKARAEAQAKRILAVNADSKGDETYMSIVKDEKLGKNTYVLITTSVLDNGVNLTDINNIVVSDMSKVKCLQMIGRARVSGKDDRKTLYVKRFGGGEVGERLRHLKRQKEAYRLYNLAYGDPPDWTRTRTGDVNEFFNKYFNDSDVDWHDAKHWFGRSLDEPDKLYLNEIAKSLVGRLIPQYEFIYDEMIEEGPLVDDETRRKEHKNYSGQKYLEYQLSWFGKVYSEDDDITFADKDKAKKAFLAFLESHAESEVQVDKEEQQRFKPDFTRLYDAAFGRADPNKGRVYSITKMNSLLEDAHINYTVVSCSSYWIVQEHDWETEEE